MFLLDFEQSGHFIAFSAISLLIRFRHASAATSSIASRPACPKWIEFGMFSTVRRFSKSLGKENKTKLDQEKICSSCLLPFNRNVNVSKISAQSLSVSFCFVSFNGEVTDRDNLNPNHYFTFLDILHCVIFNRMFASLIVSTISSFFLNFLPWFPGLRS